MSHQDAVDVTTNAQDLQAALSWLVPDEVLSDVEFRDGSFWKPLSLVYAALMWSWSGKKGLVERFDEARKIVALNMPRDETPGNSYSGFVKRLHCWSNKLIERIVAEFRRTMRQELREYYLVAGWLLLAADGSRTATPRTKSNEQRFSANKKKKKSSRKKKQVQKARKKQTQKDRDKKASTPQIWLTAIYHLGTGLPWDWRTGPSDSSERGHLAEMARDLPEGALLTMDAGFVGYDFWRELDQAGVSFVARVGSNVKLLQNLGYARHRKNTVFVWPDKAQRKRQPPLVLRLECFREGKEEVYLVTNVLEETRLNCLAMKQVYAARWGVEIYYRDLKQTFERAKLRSKAADNAQLELDWSIVGLWAMGLYAAVQHAAEGIPPVRRSIAGVLRAFRLPMEQAKCEADPGEDLESLLAIAVKDNYQRKSSKASRERYEKKKKKPIGPPDIAMATKQQQTLARQLKNNHATAA